MTSLEKITVNVTVNEPVEKLWQIWTTPRHIAGWNNINDDWHTPIVENDLREQGRFLFRMETKDGSIGFDHGGQYDKVVPNALIEYTVSDGRKSKIVFSPIGSNTIITETFEPESSTPVDLQKDFCQSILNSFKKYAETVVPAN